MDENLAIRMENEGIGWASLLGGAAGAKALDLIYNWYKEKLKRKTSASESINKTVQIYSALQNIPYHQCLRRNVFKAHNGGKILDVRTHKYASLLYEDHKPPFESIIDDVQHWRMDESYLKMLGKLTKEKVLHLYVNDMEPGRLKDLYESHDVKYCTVHYIGEDGYALYYASFATNQDIPWFDVDTRNGINIAMDKLTRLMKL